MTADRALIVVGPMTADYPAIASVNVQCAIVIVAFSYETWIGRDVARNVQKYGKRLDEQENKGG